MDFPSRQLGHLENHLSKEEKDESYYQVCVVPTVKHPDAFHAASNPKEWAYLQICPMALPRMNSLIKMSPTEQRFPASRATGMNRGCSCMTEHLVIRQTQ
ncbi:hypothetical protein AMECASPLE_028578 [Ameca splendens]|uniref:Uncharacterized protein n=1 Tax=Ameca splendens TaxID=208324 RepID=A0ABV0XUD5_9TELE